MAIQIILLVSQVLGYKKLRQSSYCSQYVSFFIFLPFISFFLIFILILIYFKIQMPKGQILYKNGDEYNGELDANQISGQGVYKLKNGSYYEGQFRNSQFHGRGKLVDKLNDLTIIGQFQNGKPNGYCRVVYSDGSEYEGGLKNGLREGKGLYKYCKSHPINQYEGLFFEDAYDGYGQLTFKDKRKYKGNFKNSLFHGEGQYKTSQFTYIGEFNNGRIEGKGIMKYTNGQYYDGQFQLNNRNGFGKFHYSNGTQYIGKWKDNLKHGKGKIKNENGDSFQCQFENDKCEGEVVGRQGQFLVVAQMSRQKLNGPIKITGEGIQIQSNYRQGLKQGITLVQKFNEKGEKVTYHGEFKQGKQNPFLVSYSHRF